METSLQFNNSVIVVLVGVRLECCRSGWKNAIPLCRGFGYTWFDFVLTWKVRAICLEVELNFYFVGSCLWHLETHWLTDFRTAVLIVCPQDFDSVAWGWQRAAGFGLGLPDFSVPIKLPGRQTGNLASHPLQLRTNGAVKELDELTCFIICSDFNKFAIANQGKNIPVVFPNNCTVVFQFE